MTSSCKLLSDHISISYLALTWAGWKCMFSFKFLRTTQLCDRLLRASFLPPSLDFRNSLGGQWNAVALSLWCEAESPGDTLTQDSKDRATPFEILFQYILLIDLSRRWQKVFCWSGGMKPWWEWLQESAGREQVETVGKDLSFREFSFKMGQRD